MGLQRRLLIIVALAVACNLLWAVHVLTGVVSLYYLGVGLGIAGVGELASLAIALERR